MGGTRVKEVTHGLSMLALCGALTAGMINEPTATAAHKGPPSVEFFGCAAVRHAGGPVCMMTPEDHLVVWVGNRSCGDLQLNESGKLASAEMLAVQGGCQIRVVSRTQPLQSTLSITDLLPFQPFQPLWSMPIDRSKPNLLQWKKRVWDRAGSDLNQIVRELQRMAGQQLDAETQIDVTYALAIANIRLGNLDVAIPQLSHVLQYASAAHYRSIAFDAAYRLTDRLLVSGMYDEARQYLKTMSLLTTSGESHSATYPLWEQALFARYQERSEEASDLIAQAMASMSRVNDLAFERTVWPIQAELLVKLDRPTGAEQLFASFEQLIDGTTDCVRANFLNGAAFVGLNLAQGQTQSVNGSPVRLGQFAVRDLFMRALESRLKCQDDSHLANLYMGLGTLELEESRYSEVPGWLAKARAIPGRSVNTDLGITQLEARLAIIGGKGAEALRLYKQLDELSRQNPDHHRRQYECYAAVGNLEAQYLLGQDYEAVVSTVRGCLSKQGNPLTPSEVRQFNRRVGRLVSP